MYTPVQRSAMKRTTVYDTQIRRFQEGKNLHLRAAVFTQCHVRPISPPHQPAQVLCRTPRRNPDVEGALSYFKSLSTWCNRVDAYLGTMMTFEQSSRPSYGGFFARRDLSAISTEVAAKQPHFAHPTTC